MSKHTVLVLKEAKPFRPPHVVHIRVVNALINQRAAAGKKPRAPGIFKHRAGLVDGPQDLHVPRPPAAAAILLLLFCRHILPPRNVHERVRLGASLAMPALGKVLEHIPRRSTRGDVAGLVVPRLAGALGRPDRHAGLVKVRRPVSRCEGAKERVSGGVKAAVRQVQASHKRDEPTLVATTVGLRVANDGLPARGTTETVLTEIRACTPRRAPEQLAPRLPTAKKHVKRHPSAARHAEKAGEGRAQ